MDIDLVSKILGILGVVILIVSVITSKAPHDLLSLNKKDNRKFFIFTTYFLYASIPVVLLQNNDTPWYLYSFWYIIYLPSWLIIFYKKLSINQMIYILIFSISAPMIIQSLIIIRNGNNWWGKSENFFMIFLFAPIIIGAIAWYQGRE